MNKTSCSSLNRYAVNYLLFSPEKFVKGCKTYRWADDLHLGFVMEWKNKIYLTNINELNSHLDQNLFEEPKRLPSQVN